MLKYAFAHPGKLGDALYCLPVMKTLCERDGATATFYTSTACTALERLFRYQPYVVDFVVLKEPEYIIQSEGQGIQPWSMPVPTNYDRIFQLGFQHSPNGPMHRFIAKEAGVEGQSIPNPVYAYPDVSFFDYPYVVMAFSPLRNSHGPSVSESYLHLIESLPFKVIHVGTCNERFETNHPNYLPLLGLDMLLTVSLLANAKAFVGFYSGILPLANGFPNLPKIVTKTATGCGEQHGLHLANTVELLRPTREVLVEAVLNSIAP